MVSYCTQVLILSPAASNKTIAQVPEAIFLYYAYLLDFDANGKGNTALAFGCDSGVDKQACTFRQFLFNTMLDSKGKGFKDPGPRDLFNLGIAYLQAKSPADLATLDTLSPDLDKVKALLQKPLPVVMTDLKDPTNLDKRKLGVWYRGVWEASALLKGLPKGQPKDFAPMYTAATNSIQDAKAAGKDSDIVAKATTALSDAHGNRVKDQETELMKDIATTNPEKGKPKGLAGINVVPGDGEVDGISYKTLDIAATAASPQTTVSQDDIEKWVKDYVRMIKNPNRGVQSLRG